MSRKLIRLQFAGEPVPFVMRSMSHYMMTDLVSNEGHGSPLITGDGIDPMNINGIIRDVFFPVQNRSFQIEYISFF